MEEFESMDSLKQISKELGIPRYKEQINYIQNEYLAPYAVREPRENSRRFREPQYNLETRSEFQRDRDRIIHSKAFRRLLYKTQVFVNHEGDHYRTRMTHSLEVSQIARGVARSLGVNEDLTEAIALGHDLGHTPFGHAVERLLADLLKNEYGFYHNEQSVRIVDCIETKQGIDPKYGLNLTWEVREGILKHNEDRTKGIYMSLEPDKPSSIEGQIVGLIDTVAYVCHDLEDGISAGLVGEKIEYGLLTKKALDELWEMFDARIESGISSIINRLVTDIVETSCNTLLSNNIDSVEKVRGFNKKIITLGKYREPFSRLKKFVLDFVYSSPMTTIMDVKAEKFIKEIYDSYWKNPKQLPHNEYKKFIDASSENFDKAKERGGNIYVYDGYKTTPARVLCDYIASMTDRFALETYDKLFNPHIKI